MKRISNSNMLQIKHVFYKAVASPFYSEDDLVILVEIPKAPQ